MFMNKKLQQLSFTIVLLLAGNCLTAQNALLFGVDVNGGTKSFPVNNRLGVGGKFAFRHQLGTHDDIRFSIGYDWFKHNTSGLSAYQLQDSLLKYGIDRVVIPVRVGYDRYLIKNALFAFAEGGFSQVVVQHVQNAIYSAFSSAFGLGNAFRLSSKNAILASISYNSNRYPIYSYQTSLNYFSLNLAYSIELKRQ
jgi:hypothetical protein